jgi:hypothetical protein
MIKKTILATALAAVAIGSVQATTLNIGGSSAYRKTLYGALTGSAGWTVVANDGTSISDNGGTHILYKKGSDYISTCWSGSEAGVQSILATNSRPLTFWVTNVAQGSVAANFNGANITNVNADAAFSDCSATISRFNGAKNLKEIVAGVTNVVSYSKPTTNIQVGVQAFTFVADENWDTNKSTSITALAARVLFEKGQIPLSLITGNAGDSNATVWLTGRNPDSGTRITAFNEVGYGALKPTVNYKVLSTNNSGKITSIGVYPTNIINGLITAPGDDGQSSGGNLVKSLAPLDSSLVVYGPATNRIITAVTTNPLATNLVTNPTTGSNSVYGGTPFAYVDPATGVYYTVKTQGKSSPATATVFNAISYNLSTNYYTNVAVNTTNSPAARTSLSTNSGVALQQTLRSSTNYFVTYASVGDANNNVTITGRKPIILSLNGQGEGGKSAGDSNLYANIQTKIKNGGYSFWNYEWALLGTNSSVGTLLKSVTDLVSANNAAPNANISDLNVTRTDGGATIYSK